MTKEFKFSVTSMGDAELKREHTYGRSGRVEKWELRKIVHLLKSAHPDNEAVAFMSQTAESYYTEDDGTADSNFNIVITPWLPLVLESFKGQKLDNKTRACLWIIACYWYYWCHGPKPGTKYSTHKPVRTDKWKEELRCPLCNKAFVPSKKVSKLGDEDILEEYGTWMPKHRKNECQAKLSKARALALSKQAEELETSREKRQKEIYNLYLEGKIAEQIYKELLQKQALEERIKVYEDNQRAWQALEDAKHFNLLKEQAKALATAESLEPLTVKEQNRLADLIQACTRIESLLAKIKGQRGVQAQRESLQKDLKALTTERHSLEVRMNIAGEYDIRMPRRS